MARTIPWPRRSCAELMRCCSRPFQRSLGQDLTLMPPEDKSVTTTLGRDSRDSDLEGLPVGPAGAFWGSPCEALPRRFAGRHQREGWAEASRSLSFSGDPKPVLRFWRVRRLAFLHPCFEPRIRSIRMAPKQSCAFVTFVKREARLNESHSTMAVAGGGAGGDEHTQDPEDQRQIGARDLGKTAGPKKVSGRPVKSGRRTRKRKRLRRRRRWLLGHGLRAKDQKGGIAAHQGCGSCPRYVGTPRDEFQMTELRYKPYYPSMDPAAQGNAPLQGEARRPMRVSFLMDNPIEPF